MSRLSVARAELAYAIDEKAHARTEAEAASQQETINDLRGEIAHLVPLHVRRYQAAMALRTAEDAYRKASPDSVDAKLTAAQASRLVYLEAWAAVDREHG